MSKVKFEDILGGRIESECIVRVMTADGIEEEIFVAPEQIEGNYLLLPAVAEKPDRVLFELPQESASGRWRLWISSEKVCPEQCHAGHHVENIGTFVSRPKL